MSRRRRDNSKHGISLEVIDQNIKKLEVEKALMFQNMMSSNDPSMILKANSYLLNSDKNSKDGMKAYLYSPEREFYTGMGYKASMKAVTYNLLRSMGKTPIVNSIITTRLEQVNNYNQFTTDSQKMGWTIRKKLSRFEAREDYKVTEKDKREIDRIATFLEVGGDKTKWEINEDFSDFLPKFLRDSLELDHAAFECQRNRGFDLIGYMPVDSGSIRILETIDPRSLDKKDFEPFKGHYPIYCQVYNNRILNDPSGNQIVYFPWELCLGIRNKQTDMRTNGYGVSELEVLIEIITWILNGFSYNGNFFKQGSNPKGFFTIEGNVNQGVLNDFKQAWRSTVAGVQNSHKVPVFEGNKINWVDMHHSNKDMEFNVWVEFLTIIACAVFRIDPNELGFHFKGQSEMFGQQGQKERLKHSKEKGLTPLLKFAAAKINKYIVSELNENYEFAWAGLDIEDELEDDVKLVNSGGRSLEDHFRKYSGREFNPEKDTILNSVYLQVKQMNMYGGQGSNEAVDNMYGGKEEGAQNPFEVNQEELGKSIDSDPIMSEAMKYAKMILTSKPSE